MAQVIWTAEARRWLQETYDYIAEDNQDAAYRTVRAIHERATTLLTSLEIGYGYHERPPIRVLLYGHSRIRCLITSGGDVEILGVFWDLGLQEDPAGLRAPPAAVSGGSDRDGGASPTSSVEGCLRGEEVGCCRGAWRPLMPRC